MTTSDGTRSSWELPPDPPFNLTHPLPADPQVTQARETLAKRLSSLQTAADAAQVLGWFIILVGVTLGVLAGIQTEERFGSDAHPYVGAGIGIAFGSVVFGTMMILMGCWATAWVANRAVR